jgi:hypothetical protein
MATTSTRRSEDRGYAKCHSSRLVLADVAVKVEDCVRGEEELLFLGYLQHSSYGELSVAITDNTYLE